MKREERTALVRQLELELKYNRFVHTMGVAYTATSLALWSTEEIWKRPRSPVFSTTVPSAWI